MLYQIPMPFCGGLSLVKIAPEPQRHAPQNFFARAAGRYMPIRARDGTRESYTHTYLTNASLGTNSGLGLFRYLCKHTD